MSGSEDLFIRSAFELIDDLDGFNDPLEVQDSVHALVKRCGYEFLAITRLPHMGDRLAPGMLISKWPPGWLTYYDRVGHYRHDPVAEYCHRTVGPFSWSEIAIQGDNERRSRRVMEEAGEHGMATGFCVPIHDLHGFQAVVSMAGEHADIPVKVRRGLHLLGIYAWNAADRTRDQKRSSEQVLTSRERDVLSRAAEGRQADAIADTLMIGTETVITHLRNARRKLGTTNTTHAVVEALRRREIAL